MTDRHAGSHAPAHLIDQLIANRLGKPVDEATANEVIEAMPHPQYLRYDPRTASPLGGRLASHLHHVEEEEAFELMAHAERFLAETPSSSPRQASYEGDEATTTPEATSSSA